MLRFLRNTSIIERIVLVTMAWATMVVLVWVLYPEPMADRWQGRCDVELSVHLLGLPEGAEVEVFLHRWSGDPESLGITNADGWTSKTVEMTCGPYRGSDTRVGVHYSGDIELFDVARNQSLGRVPLEIAIGRNCDEVIKRPHRRPVTIAVIPIDQSDD
jgi:hypothetical protein